MIITLHKLLLKFSLKIKTHFFDVFVNYFFLLTNDSRILYSMLDCTIGGLYPQIRQLYGIKNKATVSLPFN